MYRLDEALELFHSDVGHHPHKEVSTNDIDENETTFCNYGDDFKVSPVMDASPLCVQKSLCLENSDVENAQQSEKPFGTWIKAMEKWQWTDNGK